jgi:DnaK suppressor protein
MNPEQRKVYKEKLEAVLLEIEDYLSKSEDAAEAVSPDKSLGRLSRMEAMQDQQLVLEVRRRQKRRKAEVFNAISRLEQDQYGQCIFCGSQIAEERLDAFPEVQTCMKCA